MKTVFKNCLATHKPFIIIKSCYANRKLRVIINEDPFESHEKRSLENTAQPTQQSFWTSCSKIAMTTFYFYLSR